MEKEESNQKSSIVEEIQLSQLVTSYRNHGYLEAILRFQVEILSHLKNEPKEDLLKKAYGIIDEETRSLMELMEKDNETLFQGNGPF